MDGKQLVQEATPRLTPVKVHGEEPSARNRSWTSTGSRTFRVIFVRENDGVGIEPSASADKIVQYSGHQLTIRPW